MNDDELVDTEIELIVQVIKKALFTIQIQLDRLMELATIKEREEKT